MTANASLDNLLPTLVSPEILESALNTFGALVKDLDPYLIDLNVEQGRAIPKLGPRSNGFADVMLAHMIANPQFLPAFIELARFKQEGDAVKLLRALLVVLLQFVDRVQDTLKLVGSRYYTKALGSYESTQFAAKHNQPAAETILKDAKPFFKRSKAAGSAGAGSAVDGEAPVDDAEVPPPIEE